MTTIGLAQPQSTIPATTSRNVVPEFRKPMAGPVSERNVLSAELVDTQEAPESESGEQRPSARDRRQTRKRQDSGQDQSNSWLMEDPSRWEGRRVRNRKSGTIYLVRQVFRSGRVELEKNWMIYLTDVRTVRAEYEANV